MPSRARSHHPGLSNHVVPRGINREACFIEPEHNPFYLERWQQVSRPYGAALYAYCMMTNHIDILATPDPAWFIAPGVPLVQLWSEWLGRPQLADVP